ncbi:MAG TPA: hypothetical protein VMV73_03025 [Candidatus Dormibacteraeota bacterium]|nr:hypothetical protein [Candidatus Dormibacteraeota bacterium]
MIAFVRRCNGLITDAIAPQRFSAFLSKCIELGLDLIISDRDGVLRSNGDEDAAPLLAALQNLRAEQIKLAVLTGSSVAQNATFFQPLRHLPIAVFAENGSMRYDIQSDRSIANIQLDDSRFHFLTRTLKEELLRTFERTGITERLGLGTLAFPEKQTMLTVGIPRRTSAGQVFRGTQAAQAFAREVALNIETIVKAHLKVEVLR